MGRRHGSPHSSRTGLDTPIYNSVAEPIISQSFPGLHVSGGCRSTLAGVTWGSVGWAQVLASFVVTVENVSSSMSGRGGDVDGHGNDVERLGVLPPSVEREALLA